MNGYEFFSPIGYKTDVDLVLRNYYNGYFPYAGPMYNFTPNYKNGYVVGQPPASENYFNNYTYNFGGGNSKSTYNDYRGVLGPIYNFGSKKTTASSSSSYVSTPTTATNPVKKKSTPTPKEIRTSFIDNAQKYIGYSENKGDYKKFSDSKEWCADFVTYVVKESYKQKGLPVPKGFGDHRVENIKQWGINNNKFLNLTKAENKANTIKSKVNLGDLLILRENGASHIGFVCAKYKDGSFDTIEGNVNVGNDDQVVLTTHKPDEKDISGFVQLC